MEPGREELQKFSPLFTRAPFKYLMQEQITSHVLFMTFGLGNTCGKVSALIWSLSVS